jgi:flagellin
MSIIPNISSSATYADYLTKLDASISEVKTELSTGQKTLTAAEQTEVASLSAKAPQYASAEQTISQAQDVIAVAQTGLTSIKSLMARMQIIATQASSASASGADSYFLDRSFQDLLTEVGRLALSASSNGSNLLSGTASLWVQTGLDNVADTRIVVNNVNMYSLITMGVMSGITVDTPENANVAMMALNQAMAKVSGGQMDLNISAQQLAARTNNLTNLSNQAQQGIADIQHVDTQQLRAQLEMLQNLKSTYSDLVTQMDVTASTQLSILV